MRAVVQRVTYARVNVAGQVVGEIAAGLCVLLSVGADDSAADVPWMVEKLAGLRIFCDDNGKMNLDVGQIGGAILLISQFTLHGDARKGKRPSFTAAMEPVGAAALVQLCAKGLEQHNLLVQQGIFAADMQVTLCNDGPVTILLDSKRTF